jgi:hypothetical protein
LTPPHGFETSGSPRRGYISQKSMATVSERGSEKEISLDNSDKEVELIAA